MVWLEFILCAGMVIVASTFLARYADVLAEKTGLGRAWVGVILLAGVTSLPELVSGSTAVALLGQPDLAAGGVLGSCLFNLALIALLDVVYQPGSILAGAQEGHVLSGALGVLLLSMVIGASLLGEAVSAAGVAGYSVFSLLVIVIYFLGAQLLGAFERRRMAEVLDAAAEARQYDQIPARRAYGIFLASAVAVVALAIWLATLGDRLAATTGLSHSFVGTLFLAISTSLPEIAGGIAAVRLGAIDLAISNVLGSNLFNILLFAAYDIADGRANFWASLSPAHALSALVSVMMTAVAVIGLTYRASPRSPKRLTWDVLLLAALYLLALLFVYRMQ